MQELVVGALVGFPFGIVATILAVMMLGSKDTCECECTQCGKPR